MSKVNVDVTSMGNPGTVGAGVVLRDHLEGCSRRNHAPEDIHKAHIHEEHHGQFYVNPGM
ncbi:hypothetical protein SCA6_009738 [Theobroma cacao]